MNGRREPLVAAYHRRVAATARDRLAAGDARAVALLEAVRTVVVDAPDAARTARDVDVPADLDHARRATSVRVTAVTPDGRVTAGIVDHLAGEEPLAILLAGSSQDSIEVARDHAHPGT